MKVKYCTHTNQPMIHGSKFKTQNGLSCGTRHYLTSISHTYNFACSMYLVHCPQLICKTKIVNFSKTASSKNCMYLQDDVF